MIVKVVALLSLVVVVACAARCQTTAPSSPSSLPECGAGCYRYVPDDGKCYRVVACDSEGAHGAFSRGECLEICQ